MVTAHAVQSAMPCVSLEAPDGLPAFNRFLVYSIHLPVAFEDLLVLGRQAGIPGRQLGKLGHGTLAVCWRRGGLAPLVLTGPERWRERHRFQRLPV